MAGARTAIPAVPDSGLYPGQVLHRRLKPMRHRLDYRVFSILVDIDRIADIAAGSRLLAHNRFGIVGFHDRDHGPRDGSPLRPWIEGHLAARGIDLAGGPIRLLCFPRLFGYVFNPLSVWFCWHRDGRLKAVLYEVSNTFGEHHGYLLPVEGGANPIVQSTDKCFYVSPFIEMDCRYRFRLKVPGERLSILIRQEDAAGDEILIAAQTGRRRALDDRGLARALAGHPLMTLKVIAGIHWEALKLLLKGARFHKRPAPPRQEVSG